MNMETQLDLADESQAVSEQGDSTQVNTKTVAKTDSAKATKKAVEKVLHTYDTIVIGAGISGIATAHKMQQAGYDNYLVLEKADRVGGTWRDNNYPGCGCDVPSALYSFSFAPSHQWSHLFAKQPEILSYKIKFSLSMNYWKQNGMQKPMCGIWKPHKVHIEQKL